MRVVSPLHLGFGVDADDEIPIGLSLGVVIRSVRHWRDDLRTYILCSDQDPEVYARRTVLQELLAHMTSVEETLGGPPDES